MSSIRLRKSGSATLGAGTVVVDVDHVTDSIKIGDGTDLMVLQDVATIKSIPTKVMNTVPVTGTFFQATQPVSLSTLTDRTGKVQITNGINDVGLSLVGGNYALKVDVVQSTGGASGGTSSIDSAAYTPTSSSFTPTGGAFDDISSDDLAEGEMGIVRLTSGRAMHVAVQNSVAVTGTFWQATQPVSASSLPLPSGAATETTLASLLTSSQLIDDMIATLGSAIPAKASLVAGSDGTNARALKTDANGELQIDVLTMPTVAVTGTFWQATQPVSGTFWQATQPVSGTVSVNTLPAGTNNIGDVDVLTMPDAICVGKAAHDAVTSGNPVVIAGRAKNTNPTSVADGDVSFLNTDLAGRAVVAMSDRALVTRSATITLTTTTETTLLATGGAGVFHDLTMLVISNTSATAVRVDIRDATAGTIQFAVAIAANGGAVIPFGACPLNQTTAANNWTAQLSAAVTDVRILVVAMKKVA